MSVAAAKNGANELARTEFPNHVKVQYDQHVQRRTLSFFLVAVFVLAFATACGGGKTAKTTTAPRTNTTPAPAKLSFKATLVAANHHPVVNKNWLITVTATSLSGKPIAATLRLNVLTGGFGAYAVDNGKVHRFNGKYHEYITWPQSSVGFPLKLQAAVKAKGQTQKLLWAVSIVKK